MAQETLSNDWRALINNAATNPALTLDQARTETMRAFLGYVAEGGPVEPRDFAAILEGLGRAGTWGQSQGGTVEDLARVLNEEEP